MEVLQNTQVKKREHRVTYIDTSGTAHVEEHTSSGVVELVGMLKHPVKRVLKVMTTSSELPKLMERAAQNFNYHS